MFYTTLESMYFAKLANLADINIGQLMALIRQSRWFSQEIENMKRNSA